MLVGTDNNCAGENMQSKTLDEALVKMGEYDDEAQSTYVQQCKQLQRHLCCGVVQQVMLCTDI